MTVRSQPVVTTSEPHFETDDGELPANAETCLALNRAYQEIIAENLKKVEMVLAHNKDRQVSTGTDDIQIWVSYVV